MFEQAGPVKEWDASHLFAPAASSSTAPSSSATQTSPRFAIILLNAPISDSQRHIFTHLWERATLRLCADGGANRLLDAFGKDAFGSAAGAAAAVSLPHEIRGDLDSMRKDTRAFFEGRNVRITRRESQYATDLQKCIRAVEIYERDQDQDQHAPDAPLELVIYGGLSGRFDQTVHTLHVLWSLGAPMPPQPEGGRLDEDKDEDATLSRRARTWVIGEQCVVWILEPGKHVIHVSSPHLGPTCGVLPLATSSGARIKTAGLRWNLDGSLPSSLPHFISTSNHIPFNNEGRATVEIETDKAVYWSIELQEI